MNAFHEFFAQYLPQLDQTYKWPVRPKTKEGLPNFAWHPTSGTMAECIAMKQHLTEAWAKADELERARLAKWIVSDWGGVRTNSAETLSQYVAAITRGTVPASLQGVASYSKILSVVDCTQYAIYDARVAACLNAVQLLYNQNAEPAEAPQFFHYIPGRNTAIQGNKRERGFVQVFPKSELVTRRGWQEVKKDDSYATYLTLLNSLKPRFPGYQIYHFEMALFSLGPELCRRAMQTESGVSM